MQGAAPETGAVPAPGSTVVPFHGVHQAGVETPLQANATFVALDLGTEWTVRPSSD